MRARTACTVATRRRPRSVSSSPMGSARFSKRATPRRRGAASAGSWITRRGTTGPSSASYAPGPHGSTARSHAMAGTCSCSRTWARGPSRRGHRRRRVTRPDRTRVSIARRGASVSRGRCHARTMSSTRSSGERSPRRASSHGPRRLPVDVPPTRRSGSPSRSRC